MKFMIIIRKNNFTWFDGFYKNAEDARKAIKRLEAQDNGECTYTVYPVERSCYGIF